MLELFSLVVSQEKLRNKENGTRWDQCEQHFKKVNIIIKLKVMIITTLLMVVTISWQKSTSSALSSQSALHYALYLLQCSNSRILWQNCINVMFCITPSVHFIIKILLWFSWKLCESWNFELKIKTLTIHLLKFVTELYHPLNDSKIYKMKQKWIFYYPIIVT